MNRFLEKQEEFKNSNNELQQGNEKETGIAQIQNEIDTITYNDDLLNNDEKFQYLTNNFEHYKHLLQSNKEDERKTESLIFQISENIKQISSNWNENNITSFSDIVTHKNKIQNSKTELKESEKKKVVLEADYKALKTRESRINSDKLILIIGIALTSAGLVALLFQLIWLGITLIIIGLLLILAKKYIVKENPLTEIEIQLSEIKSKEESVKQEYENYLTHVLNIDKSLTPESVLELFGIIEQAKRNMNDKKEIINNIKQRAETIKNFEEKIDSLNAYLTKVSNENIEDTFYKIKSQFEESDKHFRRKTRGIQKFK